MKIGVFGAGAIGGAAGAFLARAGHDVSLIARGAHFAAMRDNGVRIVRPDGEFIARPACPASPAEAGKQDVVIVATKAQAIGEVAELIQPMLRDDTTVVVAQNGVPFWFFHRLGGNWEGTRLASVDPDGSALALIGIERIVGCVVLGAFAVVAPGIIRVSPLARYALGEPQEGISPRLDALSRAFSVPGMEAPAKARLREDIWHKLLGNASYNMICALTGANISKLATDTGGMRLAGAMIAEIRTVGEAIGIRLPDEVERMTEGQRNSGHKTSTLLDLEAGRPMEIDPIIGAVAEIGRMVGVATPTVDMVYALVRMRALQAGCYPDNPRFVLKYQI